MSRFGKALTWPVRTVGSATKALGQMVFSGRQGFYGWAVKLTKRYKGVGDGSHSSIIRACALWIARTFPEAPVQVVAIEPDGTRTIVTRHAMAEKIRRPNPFYGGVLLWMATMIDFTVSGNAYWLKVRAAANNVVQLWYAPSWMVEPKWPDSGLEFISHYDYTPAPGKTIRLEPGDVVHFRYGLDPENLRKGLSPVADLLREIFTDEEAANYTASLLANMGVPGVVFTPRDPTVMVDEASAEELKAKFKDSVGGENRGEALVLSDGMVASKLGFSPSEMDLSALRRIPEERVSAVLGIPAVVVGLGAGLDRATYSNVSEAREMAYENNIIPTQRLIAEELETQLLPDFDPDANLEVAFDLSRVRVLQPDMDKVYARASQAFTAGWQTLGDTKRAIGQTPTDTDEYYLRPFNLIAVPADTPLEALTAPAAPPSPAA